MNISGSGDETAKNERPYVSRRRGTGPRREVEGVVVRDGRIVLKGQDITNTRVKDMSKREVQLTLFELTDDKSEYDGVEQLLRIAKGIIPLRKTPQHDDFKNKIDNTVPPSAEKLLYLLLPKKKRDDVIGDLEEEYEKVVRKFGYSFARRWYWFQASTSILSMTAEHWKKMVAAGLVVKLFSLVKGIFQSS